MKQQLIINIIIIIDEFNTSKNHLFYQTLSDDPINQEEKEDVSVYE